MFGRGVIMGPTPPPISFVNSLGIVNSSSLVPPTITGIQAGDLCVMLLRASEKITIGAGGPEWPGASAVGSGRLYSRVITAGDLSATWYFEDGSGGGMTSTYGYTWLWRGIGTPIASGTIKSSGFAAASSITIPGYSPSAAGRPRAVISIMANDSLGAGAPAPPEGHALRAGTDATFQRYASDKLVGADQGAATWSALSGASNKAGWLVEVL